MACIKKHDGQTDGCMTQKKYAAPTSLKLEALGASKVNCNYLLYSFSLSPTCEILCSMFCLLFVWMKSTKTGTTIMYGLLQYYHRSHVMRNLFMPYANNKGADQPAHLHSLISTFVVRCLDSITSLVSILAISSLYLASEAEQTGLSLPCRKPQRQVFSRPGS